MKLAAPTALAAIAAIALSVPLMAQNTDTGRKLTGMLDGANEVPGAGDPDGSGMIEARVNPGQGQSCKKVFRPQHRPSYCRSYPRRSSRRSRTCRYHSYCAEQWQE